jgi:hypothetical protein
MRTVANCLNCDEPHEIVSHGLCAKCLMQQRRAQDQAGDPPWAVGPDRSQSRSQRELNKMRLNFSRMVALLDEAPISAAVLPAASYGAIKAFLIGGIDRINAMQKLTVNPENQLTVNTEAE